MRNNTLRSLINSITEKVNNSLETGIEPLAIALALRNIADQCDKLAEEFERQEIESEKNSENEESVDAKD